MGLCHFLLLAFAAGPLPTVFGQLSLPAGCQYTNCGASCPTGWSKVSIIVGIGDLTNPCASGVVRSICCTVSIPVQWVPAVPDYTNPNWPICPFVDPCPGLGSEWSRVAIDYFGDQIDKDCKQGSKHLCVKYPSGGIPTSPPTVKESVGTFSNIGCYTDSSSKRVLNGGSWVDGAMTVEKCVAKAQGFKYAGVEYQTECYWGNTIDSSGQKVNDGCTMFCAGDKSEICGEGDRIQIMQNSAYKPPATTNPGVGTFNYIGCYSDSSSARALENAWEDWSGMTVSACVQKAAGYKYAAVEYYGQCFYGNTLASSSTPQSGGCDTPCAGNTGEICGGGDRIGLYQNSAYQPPPKASAVPKVGDFVYKGCFVDSSSNRAVPDKSLVDWSGMTVEKCIAAAAGYKYAAVEYYGECYYGNKLVSTGTSSACDTPCTGNNLQLCGGGNAIGLYENEAYRPPVIPTAAEVAAALTAVSTCESKVQAVLDEWLAFLGGSQKRSLEYGSPGYLKRQLDNYRERCTSLQGDCEPLIQNAQQAVDLSQTSTTSGVTQEMAREAVRLLGNAGTVGPAIQAAPASAAGVKTVSTIVVGTIAGIIVVAEVLQPKPQNPDPDPTTIRTTTPATTRTTTTTTTSSSSTCSPTATAKPYIIHMKDTATNSDFQTLKKSLPNDLSNQEYAYDSVNFYLYVANINDCEVQRLRKEPKVLAVFPESTAEPYGQPPIVEQPQKFQKRKRVVREAPVSNHQSKPKVAKRFQNTNLDATGIIYNQPFCAPHLQWLNNFKMFSNEYGNYYAPFQDGCYYGENQLGLSVEILIIDSGLRLTHKEFDDMDKEKIVVRSFGLLPHGTEMASMAAGAYSGVAKNARIVMFETNFLSSSLIASCARVEQYVKVDKKRSPGDFVINMSWGDIIDPSAMSTADLQAKETSWKDIISRLDNIGAVMVAAAGNDADLPKYIGQAYPQALGGANTPLIIVGSADLAGSDRSWFSRLTESGPELLTFYGAGHNVLCATDAGRDDVWIYTGGTSHAAAQLSGVIATYLSDTAWVIGNAGYLNLNNPVGFSRRLKELISTEFELLKGPVGSDSATPNVPRAAAGRKVDCVQESSTNFPTSTVPPPTLISAPTAGPLVLNIATTTVVFANGQDMKPSPTALTCWHR
ncbi:hypothetical protein TWF481_010748 [Arthrobotrys musiformis]|uniref:WSC domain-containing protein n=1 Tax=Arthrobotrys musiformis TaxID=47236 RepID=A0AAV9W2Z6_9PEZI